MREREREKERKRPTGAVDGRFMYYPQLRLALTVHSFGDSLSLSHTFSVPLSHGLVYCYNIKSSRVSLYPYREEEEVRSTEWHGDQFVCHASYPSSRTSIIHPSE